MNDLLIEECPKFLAKDPNEQTHALSIPDPIGDPYIIPLSIHGVTSYFPTRRPTQQEYEQNVRYELTYETPEWDPQDPLFEEQEASMTGRDGQVRPTGDGKTRKIMSVNSSVAHTVTIATRVSQCSAVLAEINNAFIEDGPFLKRKCEDFINYIKAKPA